MAQYFLPPEPKRTKSLVGNLGYLFVGVGGGDVSQESIQYTPSRRTCDFNHMHIAYNPIRILHVSSKSVQC